MVQKALVSELFTAHYDRSKYKATRIRRNTFLPFVLSLLFLLFLVPAQSMKTGNRRNRRERTNGRKVFRLMRVAKHNK